MSSWVETRAQEWATGGGAAVIRAAIRETVEEAVRRVRCTLTDFTVESDVYADAAAKAIEAMLVDDPQAKGGAR